MTSQVVFSIRDYAGKIGRTTFHVPDVTAANFDATIAAIGALNTAVAIATAGNIVGVTLNVDTGLAGADVPVTEPNAQREIKASFYYRDDVIGSPGVINIPAADLNVIAQQGTDSIDITLAWAEAIVVAFEALAVSPAGNSITVNRAQQTSRSS